MREKERRSTLTGHTNSLNCGHQLFGNFGLQMGEIYAKRDPSRLVMEKEKGVDSVRDIV